MAKTTKKQEEIKEVAPKKPRQKKLSLKTIQAQEAELNKLSTYTLNTDDNSVIKYYKKFDERKIQELLQEAYDKLMYVQNNDEIEYFNDDQQFINFLNYLTIKHFTHFKDELKDSTFEDDITALNALLSTGLYRTILNDVFDGNETVKVISYMTEFMEAAALAIDQENKINEQILADIQSPVIKKKLEANSSYRNVLN